MIRLWIALVKLLAKLALAQARLAMASEDLIATLAVAAFASVLLVVAFYFMVHG